MIPVDVTHGSGSTYIYQHATLPNRSYMEHILISNNISNVVDNTKNHANTGDHLPISAHISPIQNLTRKSLHSFNSNIDFIPNYMWNNAAFINTYQRLISEAFENLQDNTTVQNKIEQLHKTLKNSAISAYTCN